MVHSRSNGTLVLAHTVHDGTIFPHSQTSTSLPGSAPGELGSLRQGSHFGEIGYVAAYCVFLSIFFFSAVEYVQRIGVELNIVYLPDRVER